MNKKQSHVTSGNRLAIEHEESLEKFASCEVEFLLCKISQGLIQEKMTQAR